MTNIYYFGYHCTPIPLAISPIHLLLRVENRKDTPIIDSSSFLFDHLNNSNMVSINEVFVHAILRDSASSYI